MAPDLNSFPKSPRPSDRVVSNPPDASSSSTSTLPRRTSSAMGPPPPPQNSSLPTSPRPNAAPVFDNVGVGVGPGPLRHPRPLTAAELHLELEKEQEGIVNRLTRELTQLRAQTASVASTTSSTSELFSDQYPYPSSTSIVPTSARRHRSSSNLSARSARSIREAATGATSVSGVAAPRDQSVPSSSRPSMDIARPEISRQNSTSAATQRTPSASVPQSPYVSNPHRQSLSANPTGDGHPASHPRSPSFTAAVAAARYEEAASHRAELEAVKRENEMLRQRIKDLEKTINRRSREDLGTDNSGGAENNSR